MSNGWEVIMLFELGQSSDCFAILRNLLEKHYHFPVRRPADAKESIIPSLLGILRTLRKNN